MNAKQWMEDADQVLMHTYGRYPVVLDRGEGVYLYDLDGKRYLDFGAGIAVFALGYGNRAYNEALKRQIDRLVHTSNYFLQCAGGRGLPEYCERNGDGSRISDEQRNGGRRGRSSWRIRYITTGTKERTAKSSP